MPEENRFDDIRPYMDCEIPQAMKRIAESVSFPLLAAYVFPDAEIRAVREKIKSMGTTYEFQDQVMSRMNSQVIERTMSEFTYGGLENLSRGQRYLFIANHRDIVLDSSLMQYVLHKNGYETSEITFGANLMQSQLIIDIGKSNKMFRVERPGGDIRNFYRASLHISEYIRHTILEKRQSVWIAQRNGRTKDGMDITDQGVIKMLGMSRNDNKVDSLAELNIAPVVISYEWEPCDILKTLEIYEKRQSGRYIKKPGEDINSILTGFAQYKGKVHMEFCRPLQREEIAEYDSYTLGDFNRAVAHLIDKRIHGSYRLTPNNYIAHDIRYGKSIFSGLYDETEKHAFLEHMAELREYEENCNMELLSDIFLSIYSNPVDTICK